MFTNGGVRDKIRRLIYRVQSRVHIGANTQNGSRKNDTIYPKILAFERADSYAGLLPHRSKWRSCK